MQYPAQPGNLSPRTPKRAALWTQSAIGSIRHGLARRTPQWTETPCRCNRLQTRESHPKGGPPGQRPSPGMGPSQRPRIRMPTQRSASHLRVALPCAVGSSPSGAASIGAQASRRSVAEPSSDAYEDASRRGPTRRVSRRPPSGTEQHSRPCAPRPPDG